MDMVTEKKVNTETTNEFSLKKEWIFCAILGGIMFAGTIITLGSQLVPAFILGMIDTLAHTAFTKDNNIMFVAEMAPMYLVGLPLFMLALSFLPKSTMKSDKLRVTQYIAAFPFTMFLTMFFNLFGTIFTRLISLIKGDGVNNALEQALVGVNLFWVLLFVVICAPIFEELVFRKFLVSRTAKYGDLVPVLLSGFCFGLFHGNLNQFVYAFALGCFFAYIYVRTGKIIYSIGLHMVVNFVGTFLAMCALKCGVIEFSSVMSSGNVDRMMNYLSGHVFQTIVIVGYVVILYSLTGIGALVALAMIVMLILRLVKHGKPLFDKGEVQIPLGFNVLTVLINPGMILYIFFWLIVMIAQLLM